MVSNGLKQRTHQIRSKTNHAFQSLLLKSFVIITVFVYHSHRGCCVTPVVKKLVEDPLCCLLLLWKGKDKGLYARAFSSMPGHFQLGK